MFRTLYSKLLIVFLGYGAVMTIICLLVLRVSHENFHLEIDQRLNEALAARLLKAHPVTDATQPDHDALRQVFDHLTVINPGISVYLLDSNGQILASSGPPGKVERQRIDMQPIRAFLDHTKSFPILGQDPSDLTRREVFSAATVSIRGYPNSILYVLLHRQRHISSSQELERSYALAGQLVHPRRRHLGDPRQYVDHSRVDASARAACLCIGKVSLRRIHPGPRVRRHAGERAHR